jgi:hypothetical protein
VRPGCAARGSVRGAGGALPSPLPGPADRQICPTLCPGRVAPLATRAALATRATRAVPSWDRSQVATVQRVVQGAVQPGRELPGGRGATEPAGGREGRGATEPPGRGQGGAGRAGRGATRAALATEPAGGREGHRAGREGSYPGRQGGGYPGGGYLLARIGPLRATRGGGGYRRGGREPGRAGRGHSGPLRATLPAGQGGKSKSPAREGAGQGAGQGGPVRPG